jgi:hypothetical protein
MKEPSAVSAAEGICWVNPERRVRSIPVETESTDMQAGRPSTTPQPWQTWGSVARYAICRLAQATPTVLLLWETCIRRLAA